MNIHVALRLSAALLLTLVAGGFASTAVADDAEPFSATDCTRWKPLEPLDRKNVGDDFALKWKDYLRRDARSDQLNQALRCLGSHLAKLEASIDDQTKAVEGGAYLNDVERQLDGVGDDLKRIHQALDALSVAASKSGQRAPAGGGTSVPVNNTLSADLRVLINQQTRLSESLLEKLDRLHEEPSWIVVKSDGTGHKPDADGSEAAGSQVRADEDVSTLFPDASHIEFAIVTVADPRVPRHRRLYDNAITAISHGLLVQGFVLDRYEFPWQDALKATSGADQALLNLVSKDERFGLMIFRRDDWRYEPKKPGAERKATIQIRAVYVVPETATYGVQSAAFLKAVQRIDGQLYDLGRGSETLEIFGPTFSGSLDSIAREVVRRQSAGSSLPAWRAVAKLKATSATVTARSNARISGRELPPFEFASLAQTDAGKLEALKDLQVALGIPTRRSTAFLYESSVFGFDACHGEDPPAICHEAKMFAFPANIADVRFGIRKREAERTRSRSNPIIPSTGLPHLSLEEGAENGSEFPESFQSPLTAVANQLDLDVAVAALDRSAPRMAVIIATDVRDRLFLFEQLRSQLENTMLFDLETDRLLAHPDMMNVSRGAMTLASAEITSENGAWSTDLQAIMESQFCAWSGSHVALVGAAHDCNLALGFRDDPEMRGVHLHVVTRNGLTSASQVSGTCRDLVRCNGAFRLLAPAMTIVFCVLLTLLWSWNPVPVNQAQVFDRCLSRRLWFSIPLIIPLFYVQPTGRPVLLLIIVGIVGGTFSLYRIYTGITSQTVGLRNAKAGLRTEWSWRALPWFAGLMILVVAILEIWNAFLFLRPEAVESSVIRQVELLRVALTGNAAGGLAYGMALSAVAGALLYSFAASKAYSAAGHRNQFVRGRAVHKHHADVAPSAPADLRRKVMSLANACYVRVREGGCLWVLVAIGGGSALAIIVSEVLKSGTRVTIFGERASITIYLGLLAVTLSGAIMFVAALWIVSQINTLRTQLEGSFLGFKWDLSKGHLPQFVATPIFATTERAPGCITKLVENPEHWRKQFADILDKAHAPSSGPAPNDCWLAPSALLASYMMIYRWAVIGVLIAALAAAGVVYLFPVSDSDGLLLFNLALLLGIGLHSAFVTVKFESCELLSMLLCNREQKLSWSTSLFAFIAFPFAALAIAVAIAQIPGVLNWGDGIFDLLIKLTRPSVLK